jgi:hypothetical protein
MGGRETTDVHLQEEGCSLTLVVGFLQVPHPKERVPVDVQQEAEQNWD